MITSKVSGRAVIAATLAMVIVSVSPALAKRTSASLKPSFSKPISLPNYDGGEPSIAVDPSGNGDVYVTAPQGAGSATQGGVGFWGSHDHGRTFPYSNRWGSAVGGGDSDVAVGTDHTVYIADLELAANAICRSSDSGQTFIDAGAKGGTCEGVPSSQPGPISDREWLSPGPNGDIYFTWHDLHAELPYVTRSTDQGKTFAPCGGTAFGTGSEFQSFTPGPTSGTQVSKPVISSDGTVSVMFATGAGTNSSQGGSFDHLWLSTTPSCTATSLFTTQLVYQGAGASLAQPFDGLAMDGAGTMYVLASGHVNSTQTTDNVWLFVLDHQTQTWSAPIRVNTPDLTANMLPAITAGTKKGEVAISWYGSSKSTSRAGSNNEWRYYVATSFDSGKHFNQSTASGIVHKGAQARALLDFSSLTVEPGTGAVMAAFAADATGTRHAMFVRQTGGRFLR